MVIELEFIIKQIHLLYFHSILVVLIKCSKSLQIYGAFHHLLIHFEYMTSLHHGSFICGSHIYLENSYLQNVLEIPTNEWFGFHMKPNIIQLLITQKKQIIKDVESSFFSFTLLDIMHNLCCDSRGIWKSNLKVLCPLY